MSNAQQLPLPGVVAESAIEWVWAEDEEGVSEVTFVHETVMKYEVTAALAPEDGALYVDVTLGGGGHTEAILEAALGARVIAFDRDEVAVLAAKERLARFGDRVTIVQANFASATTRLAELGITKVRGLCADLGVSSPQLDDPSRGMSFRREGPIDMRMDRSSGETALELLERLDDDELANVIYRYGDERRSRRIARSIKRALDDRELVTTLDLRRAIVRAVGPVRVGGVDPATRTFQALRIAVNQELGELESLLAALPDLIELGGVAAIISFHSLEDRQVKSAFHQRDTWEPLSKKPVGATEEECAMNLRSRSAKMRAARRIEAREQRPEPREEDYRR
jgi:16S rRNA (cytosine1402-N4)-methyltransferase